MVIPGLMSTLAMVMLWLTRGPAQLLRCSPRVSALLLADLGLLVTLGVVAQPATAHLVGAAGAPPTGPWACEAEASRYPGPPERHQR